MKPAWSTPKMETIPIDLKKLGDVRQLSDAELKIQLEKAGFRFRKKYQAVPNYIHRKIADSDVLISVSSNIANFNGYIEINESGVLLWNALQSPCSLHDLEQVLETQYQISHETAVEDVLDFINLLREHDMVQVKDEHEL